MVFRIIQLGVIFISNHNNSNLFCAKITYYLHIRRYNVFCMKAHLMFYWCLYKKNNSIYLLWLLGQVHLFNSHLNKIMTEVKTKILYNFLISV